jgi:hypothetical protein
MSASEENMRPRPSERGSARRPTLLAEPSSVRLSLRPPSANQGGTRMRQWWMSITWVLGAFPATLGAGVADAARPLEGEVIHCRSGGDLRVSRKADASLATSHAPANPRAAVSAPDRAVAIGRLGRSDVARPRERPLAGRSFPRRRDGCPRRSSRCSPSWSRSKA